MSSTEIVVVFLTAKDNQIPESLAARADTTDGSVDADTFSMVSMVQMPNQACVRVRKQNYAATAHQLGKYL